MKKVKKSARHLERAGAWYCPRYLWSNNGEMVRVITVRKLKNGFRCDMCFSKPDYEICGDDRYNELPAFTLHLCKEHAEQLVKNMTDAFVVIDEG